MKAFDLSQAKTARERDKSIRQMVQHIIKLSKRHNQTEHVHHDLKDLPMEPIKHSYYGDNAIVAIFRDTLSPQDIYRIESAATGIAVCDYTTNYDFWREFIRAITQGRGIDEADVYTIRCTEYEDLLNEALLTYIRLSQGDNLIALMPITNEVNQLLSSSIEAFYLNKASVEAFAAEYSRMEQNLQFFDGDQDSFTFETIHAVKHFKIMQEHMRLTHLKRFYGQISQLPTCTSL